MIRNYTTEEMGSNVSSFDELQKLYQKMMRDPATITESLILIEKYFILTSDDESLFKLVNEAWYLHRER